MTIESRKYAKRFSVYMKITNTLLPFSGTGAISDHFLPVRTLFFTHFLLPRKCAKRSSVYVQITVRNGLRTDTLYRCSLLPFLGTT